MATMVPVPSRVFKQFSTWVMIVTAVADAAHVLAASLGDLHVVTGTQLGVVNAALVFVAMAAKLIKQNIALTPDEKETLIEAVANSPTKKDPAGPQTQPPTPLT